MKCKQFLRKICFGIGFIALSFVFIFPIYWAIVTSLKTHPDIFAIPPVWFFKPTITSYRETLSGGFLNSLANSVIVSVISVFISIGLGTAAAYAFSQFEFKGKENLRFWILVTQMAPPIAVLIPLYIFFRILGIIQTRIPLILTYFLINIPLTVWLMKAFFDEIPPAIREAAVLDGCSSLGVLWRIFLPLGKSGLLVTALVCLIFSWNELLFAMVLTTGSTRTAPVMIIENLGYQTIDWGNLTASAILVTIPVVIFAIFIQKHIVKGLILGAFK